MIVSFVKFWAIAFILSMMFSLVVALPVYSTAVKYGENPAIAVYAGAIALVTGIVSYLLNKDLSAIKGENDVRD